ERSLNRKAASKERVRSAAVLITAILQRPWNQLVPVLSTHANPKAGPRPARIASRRAVLSSRSVPTSLLGQPVAGQTELAMASKNNANLREALTFDDVLIKPGLSELLPSEADLRSQVTRSIPLNLPIIASAMDTVTEAAMAIAMAQAGGIGVVHRNLEPDQQAAQVRQVKKFESGMVVNPLTIAPDAMLQQALDLMKENRISGIPVVERSGSGPGKLVGILTNRDVRFANDPRQP